MKEEKLYLATTKNIRGRSVDRLLDILDLLEHEKHDVTVKNISERINAPKSTIYLLVELLVERGYLEFHKNGCYQIGSRLGRLGIAYMRKAQFPKIARDILDSLAERTGVVAELVILDDWTQLVLFAAVSEANPYMKSPEGRRFPLPHTASSRFLLRDVSEAQIRDNIPLHHFTLINGNVIDQDEFISSIAETRSDKFYVTRGDVDPHLSCIATPIFSLGGECIASLSLVMPILEIDEREAELVTILLEASDSVNEKLKMGLISKYQLVSASKKNRL